MSLLLKTQKPKNPAYTQIMNVCDKGVNLAACGGDITKATKLRVGTLVDLKRICLFLVLIIIL